MILFAAKARKKMSDAFDSSRKKVAELNAEIESSVSGVRVTKAYNAENKMLEKFNKSNELLCESAWISQFLSGLMHPIMQFISNLGYVVIAILGGYFCIKGKIYSLAIYI